jgi:hypothetical protein
MEVTTPKNMASAPHSAPRTLTELRTVRTASPGLGGVWTVNILFAKHDCWCCSTTNMRVDEYEVEVLGRDKPICLPGCFI